MKINRVVTGYLEENCYVLSCGEECLVVDPGDDYLKIKECIRDKKVVGVLVTHHHFDHISSLSSLLNDYYTKEYSFSNLKEGPFSLGNFSFDVIYTPGHTNDSISFYFKEENMMFTGDFLFKESIGRWDLPTGNFSSLQKSIDKIKKYKDDIVVLPGHGDKTTLGYEKNNNQYLFTK